MSYMPSKSPPNSANLKKTLGRLGQQIRMRRRALKVSAIAASEAAGISRMTLNRIEGGEASVTLGAYLNVISALGLAFELNDPKLRSKVANIKVPKKVRLDEYPGLRRLAWQLKDKTEVTPEEALDLYERNWRHIEHDKMNSKEQGLINALLAKFGRKGLLV